MRPYYTLLPTAGLKQSSKQRKTYGKKGKKLFQKSSSS